MTPQLKSCYPRINKKQGLNPWILSTFILLVLLTLTATHLAQKQNTTYPSTTSTQQPQPTDRLIKIQPTYKYNSPYQHLKAPCQVASTGNKKRVICKKYPLSFEMPNNWQYLSNVNEETLKQLGLENGAIPNVNDIVVNNRSCSIYLGPGGSGEPTTTVTSEETEIDGKLFTKRTWYENNKVLFIAYLQKGEKIGNLENLWVYSPKQQTDCLQTTDQILSTFQFLEGSANAPQDKADLCIEEKNNIISLVDEFENMQKAKNAIGVLSLFTSAMSSKDVETYNHLSGKDTGYPRLYSSGNTNFKLLSYTILQQPEKTLANSCGLLIQEERQYWQQGIGGWQNPVSIQLRIETVKLKEQWKIDRYQSSTQLNYQGKYSGW